MTGASLLVALAAASPASGAVVINEVESDGVADFIELTNTGPSSVDIGGYVLKDSDNAHAYTVAGGTSLAVGGYYAAYVEPGFGLGKADSARLFSPTADLLDSYSWTDHAIATWGRCPDGTGPIGQTATATPDAVNDCPPPAAPAAAWPGGASVATADAESVLGTNVSGLAYQPSGSGARGVLWAVRNGPSTLYRLIYDGTKWTPDTANGWGLGKQLLYPDGSGVPDAEGVTLAGGDANGIFVSTERNDSGGFSNTSRPSVLRYDTSTAATSLSATREWNLSADLPGLGANAGLEAVAWIPDSLLVAKGLVDDSTGAAYNPATHPGHGGGLFFVGVEQDGKIVGYALDQTTGAYTRVTSVASGFPRVMDLEYEPETTHLWAVCDDTCNGRTATLDIAASGPSAGHFAIGATYERPAGMTNLNNEGFAIAPQAECVGGVKPVFWADDSNDAQHAIRAGTLACTAPVVPTVDTPIVVATPGAGAPAPAPATPDRTPPVLKTSLTLTKTGPFAVRKTGKFGVVVTLDEAASLAITATARKTSKSKARPILATTQNGIAAGKRTITLSLTKSKRKSLRKGETITVTIVATDANGNAAAKTIATAKVR